MGKLITTIKSLWDKVPQHLKHVVHTAWQVGLGTLLAHLVVAHSSQDVKAAVAAAFSVAFATLKAALVARS